MHFGITSPNISTNIVTATVLIAAPISPNRLMQSTVATDEQPIFTMLFPIRIDVRALSYCLVTLSAFLAFLLPFSALSVSLITLTVEKAVSIDEKTAEKQMQIIVIISINESDKSNIVHSIK
jgi:hypothetical protein